MFKNVNKSQVYFFILAHLYFYGSSFAPENGYYRERSTCITILAFGFPYIYFHTIFFQTPMGFL